MCSVVSKRQNLIYLLILLAVFFIFGSCYIFIDPIWSAPDEISHFTYSKYILDHQDLPNYFTHLNFWEAHQPPLYYLLSSIVLLPVNNLSIDIQVYVLRYLSLLMGLITVLVSYFAVRKVFPDKKYIYLGIPTFIATLPMYQYISASINNDNLANLFGAILIYYICSSLRDKLSSKLVILASLFIGMSIITKIILLPLAAILGIIIFIRILREKSKKIVKMLYLIIPIILISSWWFIRNYILYGEPLGWAAMSELWSGLQYKNIFNQELFITWWKTIYKSFFGIFGKLNILLPIYVYLFYSILTVVSIFGWFQASIRKKYSTVQRNTVLILLFGFFITLFGVFYNSTKFYQPQGRYLFPALISIAIIIVPGLFFLIEKKYKLLLSTIVVIILLGINILSVTTIYGFYQDKRSGYLIDVDLIYYDQDRWIIQSDITSYEFLDKGLRLTSAGSDPFVFTPDDLRIPSRDIKQIILEMKISNGNDGQLFWKSITDPGFEEEHSIGFTILAGDEWNEYILPVGDAIKNSTIINQFRIDPTDTTGEIIIKKLVIE